MSIIWQMLGQALGSTAGEQASATSGAAVGRAATGGPRQVAPDKVADLADRLDRVSLLCVAMWSLLKETGMTDQKLLDRMKEIDLSDGRLDGKYAPVKGVVTCTRCGHPMSRRHRRCLYCGNTDLKSQPEDTL